MNGVHGCGCKWPGRRVCGTSFNPVGAEIVMKEESCMRILDANFNPSKTLCMSMYSLYAIAPSNIISSPELAMSFYAVIHGLWPAILQRL